MLKEYIINEFGINPKVADICFDAEKKVEKYFKKIDEITEYNQCKVIKAMQKIGFQKLISMVLLVTDIMTSDVTP